MDYGRLQGRTQRQIQPRRLIRGRSTGSILESTPGSLLESAEVELDGSGAIVGLTAIDPQQLAKEKLSQFGNAAQEHGKQAAELARYGVGALAARMGKTALGATIVLWIAWFFMPFYSFTVNLFGVPVVRSFTYWGYLGAYLTAGVAPTALNPDGTPVGSHGLGSFIGLLAIAAPLMSPFLRRPSAKYLNTAPLAYLLLGYLKYRWDIEKASDIARTAVANNPLVGMLAQMAKEVLNSSSYEYGAFVLVGASIALTLSVFGHR